MSDPTHPTPGEEPHVPLAPSPSPPVPPYGESSGAPPYNPPPWAGAPPYSPPSYNYPAEGASYEYATGPTDRLGRPLAEWWQRAVAIVIDGIILYVVFLILTALVGGSPTVTSQSGTVTVQSGNLIAAYLIELVVTLVYFGLLDGSAKGQTVGKLALGIATRDINTGGPIGLGRAVLRRFIYSILWVALFIPGLLNVLSPLWDGRRQAWHDKVASSDVVKIR